MAHVKPPEAKVQRHRVSTVKGTTESVQERLSFVTRSLNQTQRLTKRSPLENFLCLLFGDLDPQVPQGLHDLLSVDPSCNNTRGSSRGPSARKRPKTRGSHGPLTVILLVQTLEHQPQLLLMILQIMDKFFKVQLPIEVFISSLHNFLQNRRFCP